MTVTEGVWEMLVRYFDVRLYKVLEDNVEIM